MRRYISFYLGSARASILDSWQYRAAQYFYMIGMIAEPVIYLVVWSTVARAQGGEVGGYTPGQFAAYYLVWTLVRNMNIVFTPYGWEWRIRQGMLSNQLLRPLHPLHGDIAIFGGMKLLVIVLWLPLAAFLALFFKPELNPTLLEVVVFFFAIWGAYLIRTMALSMLGMVTFWTTRVSALYELYFATELLLSGRLVPMSLMPDWVERLSYFFPFRWTFGYPIEALIGTLTPQQLISGLGMQLLWIVIGTLATSVMWRFGIRRFSSVGG